jgi:putative FmdB family regulatory protein
MLTYEYLCKNEDCKYNFEIKQSIQSNSIVICPECKLETLQRVSYPSTIFDASPKTVGSLAEKNTSNLGRYGRENLWQTQKEKKIKAWETAREELSKKLPSGASIPHAPE